MGEICLITGGARSGKSRFAEELLAGEPQVVYVATALATDAEMQERIRLHRAGRNPNWRTVEAWRDLPALLAPVLEGCGALLLDCVTIMVTNLLLADPVRDWDRILPAEVAGLEREISAEFSGLLTLLQGFTGRSLLVTNELGMGLVPEYPLGRHFRDIAGRINQQLAAAADTVYLLVAGIPVALKGGRV